MRWYNANPNPNPKDTNVHVALSKCREDDGISLCIKPHERTLRNEDIGGMQADPMMIRVMIIMVWSMTQQSLKWFPLPGCGEHVPQASRLEPQVLAARVLACWR
eukprot:gnl/MRDRNA2_/MRDRNA2_657908_c0_seq1.p2 gnl/MRDRNA2_/MRDRNA2_657908_c0~~gnl/MRDRNA2_/MRDRNA2_657908_c0_seq1.p2  ORF type:complete len:104 (+),score=11.79 gnl/MRDRNA2_/MRDRNA2_657908_c0_seq1:79-390(+)